jgi:hypothetical protein
MKFDEGFVQTRKANNENVTIIKCKMSQNHS